MDSELLSIMNTVLNDIPSHVAVAFSGGLDSAILAKLLEGRCRLYIAGAQDSQDIQEGVALADAHGWDVLPVIMDEGTVRALLPRIVPLLSSPSPMTFNFNLPLFLSAESACEMTVVAGHGADELFGGYDRYTRMDDETFMEESEKDVEALIGGDLQDSKSIVASTGHVMETPYLSRQVVEHAMSLPRDMRCDKKALRNTARELGLEVHDRRKKAAQFGSGAARLLKRIVREEGCGETELINAHRR